MITDFSLSIPGMMPMRFQLVSGPEYYTSFEYFGVLFTPRPDGEMGYIWRGDGESSEDIMRQARYAAEEHLRSRIAIDMVIE